MKKIVLILTVSLLVMSCVPLKQFSDLKDKNESTEKSNQLLKEENRDLTVELNELQSKFQQLMKKYNSLEEKSKSLSKTNRELAERNEDLEENLNNLEKQIGALQNGSSDEISKLLKDLQVLQEDLQEREDKVRAATQELNDKEAKLMAAQSELDKKEAELNNAEQTLTEQQAKLQELQSALDGQKNAVSQLKEKLNKALYGFYDQGLSVYEKNGKVYVSLEEQLMFKTGSYNLDPKGQEALKSLSEVLAANPDINIMVEGHTDNVPLNGSGQVKDNWDLSCMRATAVSKIILNNTGIEPSRITAAGRSEYVPLDTENTPEARKKNRRTEIILTPDLSEVFKMLE